MKITKLLSKILAVTIISTLTFYTNGFSSLLSDRCSELDLFSSGQKSDRFGIFTPDYVQNEEAKHQSIIDQKNDVETRTNLKKTAPDTKLDKVNIADKLPLKGPSPSLNTSVNKATATKEAVIPENNEMLITQYEVIREEYRVNDDTLGGYQTHATVATNSLGETMIVWDSSEKGWGVESDIRGVFIGSNGRVLEEITISVTNGGSQRSPDVVAKGNIFVVAWESRDLGSSDHHVYARTYDSGTEEEWSTGGGWSEEIQITDTPSVWLTWPDVSMFGPDGNFVVVWDQITKNAGNYEMNYIVKAYKPSGQLIGGPVQLNDIPSSLPIEDFNPEDQRAGIPDIDINDNGDGVAVWQQFDSENLPVIRGSQFNVRTGIKRTDVIVSEPHQVGVTQRRPMVDINNRGDIAITWYEIEENGDDGDIYVRRLSAVTKKWSTAFVPHQETADKQSRSVVKLTESGDLIVAWTSYNKASSSGDIYMRFYDENNLPSYLGEIRVNDYILNREQRPAMDLFEDEEGVKLVITWESELQDGTDCNIFSKGYLLR